LSWSWILVVSAVLAPALSYLVGRKQGAAMVMRLLREEAQQAQNVVAPRRRF
jgi:hypothetical protein